MVRQPRGTERRHKPPLKGVAKPNPPATILARPAPEFRRAAPMHAAASDPSSPRWPLWLHCLVWGTVAAAGWWLCFSFPAVWIITGIGEPNRPFFDLHALMAARDAVRLGLDPRTVNPLDPYHRPWLYTTWWLAFPSLGLGRKDTLWVGASWTLLLLVCTVTWLKPRSWREGVVVLLLLFSPAFLLAANRANNDVIVFAVVSLGLVCLRRRALAWQLVGVAALALAAVLKYYPLVTVLLVIELRPWRRCVAGLAVYAGMLMLAWPGIARALSSAARNSPAPEWLYAFGAPMLWRDLGSGSQLGWLGLGVAVAVGAAALAAWSPRLRADPITQVSAVEREFFCGALMIVGVFFLGASYAYKLIFVVWLLPWLGRTPTDPGERRWRRITMGLIVAVLWLEGLGAIGLNLMAAPDSERALALLRMVLVVQQILEWAFVACLLRFIFVHIGRWARAPGRGVVAEA
jgi:hypothetical protein